MTCVVEAAAGDFVRLRVDLAYDGGDFSGWARQPGRRTVQGELENALGLVLRLTEAPSLVVAGRTDAGVHAGGQVCHLDVPADRLAVVPADRLARRLRRLLPPDIVVHRVATVTAEFDARFSALARHYEYRVDDGHGDRDPLTRRSVLWWPRPLDVAAMDEAAQGLVGEHDFLPFCKPRPGATTIRALRELRCERRGSLVVVSVCADAFCHHMVRSLVGALLRVGEHRRPTTWPEELLRAGARDSGVPVIAPHGLTLVGVDYPPDDELADRARVARATRGSEPAR